MPSSESSPRIRIAMAHDGPALREIARATWSHVHNPMPAPQCVDEPFFNQNHQPDDVLVAERSDLIAGYILIGRSSQMEANAHVRQIQGLAVSDGARRHGVARALLRAALDQLQRSGTERVTLRVLGHNTAARRLYESEGFVVEGVLRGEFLLDGEYVDDVLMGRRIQRPG